MSKKKFETKLTESPLSRALAENAQRLEEVRQEVDGGGDPKPRALAVVTEPAPAKKKAKGEDRAREEAAEKERQEAVRRKAEEASKRRAAKAAVELEDDDEPPVIAKSQAPQVRKKKRSKHLELEDDEFDQLEDFVTSLARPSGGKVSFNVLGRALFRIAMRSQEQIFDELREKPPGRKPANEKVQELSLYEDEWERVLEAAVRRSPGQYRIPRPK